MNPLRVKRTVSLGRGFEPRRHSLAQTTGFLFVIGLSVGLLLWALLSIPPPATYVDRVREKTKQTFRAYERTCKGRDEYFPGSRECEDLYGLGITALDSAGTLHIMGLEEEYERARKFAETLDIANSRRKEVSLFEVVIRALGGLISAHSLTEEPVWRQRAIELGNAMLPAFGTKTGCPAQYAMLNARVAVMSESRTTTADAGTYQLEMRTLSAMSGDARFGAAADRCEQTLLQAMPKRSLVPGGFNLTTGKFFGDSVAISGGVDSFVEMLLKNWIASGKRDDELRTAFERSVELVFSQTVVEAGGELLMATAELDDKGTALEPNKVMAHLSCFFPGALGLAALHGLGGGLEGTKPNDYMTRARRLTRSCYLMSRSNPHGLAPEETDSSSGSMLPLPNNADSLLRPEIIESIYIMHEITGGKEKKYREWGRRMWDAIEANGTLPNGRLSSTYALDEGTVRHGGKLHSFVVAETLKYFFLLFREQGDGPDLNLTDFVFNTEAHPIQIIRPRVAGKTTKREKQAQKRP